MKVSVSLTARSCGVGQRKGLVSGSKAPQHVGALCSHGSSCRPLVHLLRSDVVIEKRLPVLKGGSVRKATDEVGVGVGIRWVRSEVPRQVVGCGVPKKKKKCQEFTQNLNTFSHKCCALD